MEALREWLLGVFSCLLLSSAARQMTAGSVLRDFVGFIGGLLLILSVFTPLSAFRTAADIPSFSAYRENVARERERLTEKSERVFRERLAETLEARIEEKADALSCPLRAKVTLSDTGEVPVPTAVRIDGEWNAALSDWIAQEMGLPHGVQEWREGA